MTLNEAYAAQLRDTAAALNAIAVALERNQVSGEFALGRVDAERQALSERSQLFADRMEAERN